MRNDALICPVCRREGHKLGVIVKTPRGTRNIAYCICCGRVLEPEKVPVSKDKSKRLQRQSRERRSAQRVHK